MGLFFALWLAAAYYLAGLGVTNWQNPYGVVFIAMAALLFLDRKWALSVFGVLFLVITAMVLFFPYTLLFPLIVGAALTQYTICWFVNEPIDRYIIRPYEQKRMPGRAMRSPQIRKNKLKSPLCSDSTRETLVLADVVLHAQEIAVRDAKTLCQTQGSIRRDLPPVMERVLYPRRCRPGPPLRIPRPWPPQCCRSSYWYRYTKPP